MKVFIVLHDYSNMEKHYDEYGTFRVIEKDFSAEKSKEE